MALYIECNACQMGDHDGCQKIMQYPPEGGVGGIICSCKGECRNRDRTEAAVEFMNKALGITDG
jgi:hypothetical protein